jgi:hypothetical protein
MVFSPNLCKPEEKADNANSSSAPAIDYTKKSLPPKDRLEWFGQIPKSYYVKCPECQELVSMIRFKYSSTC